MGTGNQTWDYRTAHNTPDGVYHEGRIGTRAWNGGNSPRNPDGSLQLRENPYTGTRVMSLTDLIKYRWRWQPPTSYPYFNSSRNFMPSPSFPWSSNDDLELWSRLATKIRGSDFNLAVFTREGRESCRMISETATRLQDGMLAVSQKKYKKARRILKVPKSKVGPLTNQLSANWLAYSFGWKPLVSDLVSAAVFLNELTNNLPNVEYRAFLKKPGVWEPDGANTTLRSDNKSAEKIGILRALFESPVPKYVHQGLVAPEEVVWEGLPYSFLLDYVAPIGDYLSTVGLFTRVGLLGTFWRTDFTKFYVGPPWRGTPTADRQVQDVSGLLGWHSAVVITRQNVSSRTIPGPSFRPLNEIADWRRATNVVALFIAQKARLARNEKVYYNRD